MTNEITDSEIIDLLDGPTAIAKLIGIKAPSVSDWREKGIPEPRLIQLAAQLEIKSAGRFSRKARWPDNYAIYWPELARPAVNTEQTA